MNQVSVLICHRRRIESDGGYATVATKHDIINENRKARTPAGPTARMAVLHHRSETPDYFLQAASNLA